MKKRTLQFATLEELVRFSKLLPDGYLLNTITLTIKTTLSPEQLEAVLRQHQLRCTEVGEAVATAA